MSNNFDIFRNKHNILEEYKKSTEVSKEQAKRSIDYDFIDPHVRILSDYPSGIVEYNILSDSIDGLQKIAQSAYNYAFGSKSKKGRLPDNIVKDSKLLITGMVPGSFIVTFDSAVNKRISIPTEKQISLDFGEKSLEVVVKNSIDLLKDVIDGVVNIESESDAESFLNEFGDRTYREASNFLNIIKNNSIDIDIGFGHSYNGILKLEKEKVLEKIDILEYKKIRITKKDQKFTGKLIGISNLKKEMTFLSEEENIVIKVLDDSLSRHEMVTNILYDFKVALEIKEDVIKSSIISKEYFIESIDEIIS